MKTKAQTGKIIALPIVIIIVVLIMFIFVALSTGLSIFKRPTAQPSALTTSPSDNLMLQTVKVKVEEKEKDLLVIDALQLHLKEKVKLEDLTFQLQTLLNENNNCYIFYDKFRSGSGYNEIYGYEYLPESNTYKEIKIETLLDKTATITLNPTLNREYVYYYGPCS
jgi:hypothetical protein